MYVREDGRGMSESWEGGGGCAPENIVKASVLIITTYVRNSVKII